MIQLLEMAARKAGETLIDYFKKGVTVTPKTSHQNFVTEADIQSQVILEKILREEMIKKGYKPNEIGFIGEENLNKKGRYTFVIDPLDGTTNFASGVDFFGISIGFFDQEKPIAGIFYNPAKNVVYSALHGKGAFKNGKKLEINYGDLKNCLANTYISTDPEIAKQHISIINKLNPDVKGHRIFGSALGSCLVAENIFSIYYESSTHIWDITPPESKKLFQKKEKNPFIAVGGKGGKKVRGGMK